MLPGPTPTTLILALAFLGGCSNPYAQYYVDLLDGHAVAELPKFIPFDGEPKLFLSNDLDSDIRTLYSDGFEPIGYASFNGVLTDSMEAVRVAEEVGAEVILLMQRHTETLTGSVPFTVQNPSQTISTQHSGTIYGPSGLTNYSGQSTTMVPGGFTTYNIPYSVSMFDHVAVFWARLKPPILGLLALPLTDENRRAIGSNHGAVVDVVMKDSPAFHANILRGDVIIRMGDTIISDPAEFSAAIGQYAGQKVIITLIRDGVERQIHVLLNQRSY